MKNSTLFKKAIEQGMLVGHTDIETSPYLNYTYQTRNTFIGYEQVICPMQVTSIAYLFEGDTNVVVRGWDNSKEANGTFDLLKKDRDTELLRSTIPILNEADIIIGQNSTEYDLKKLQWRLNVLKLPKLQNIISLDILKQSYKAFSPLSHKLDYRSKEYGYGGKDKHHMEDWIKIAMGDKKAQKRLMLYNGKDVLDAQKIFWKELDYYTLPTALVATLKQYISTDQATFCIKCAARRQSKFNISKQSSKSHIKMTCKNCDFSWKINK